MKQICLEEEYSKKTGVTPQDVAALRQWLRTQPHLPEKYITDLEVILAYHSCALSSGLAKQVLDLNYTLRSMLGFLNHRTLSATIEHTARSVVVTPLSLPTKEGYRILYSHLLDSDPKNFNFEGYLRSIFMCFDIVQYEEGTWPGLVFVMDYEHVSLGHVAKLDLFVVQQVLYFLQDAALVKIKGLHFINATPLINKVMNMIRPFMKKEMMQILHIHTRGSRTLQQFVPVEAMPRQSGGQGNTYEEYRDIMISKLRDYQEYFALDQHKRVDESLRPGKPKSISDIFGGVEGSFKKLEID